MKAFGITVNLNKLPDYVEKVVTIEVSKFKELYVYTSENMQLAWGSLLLMTVICYLFSYVFIRVKKL